MDLIIQFARLWGSYETWRRTDKDEKIANILASYDSEEMLSLLQEWAEEYSNTVGINDTVEFFEQKIEQLYKEIVLDAKVEIDYKNNDELSIQARNLYEVFVKELLAYNNLDDGFIPSNSSLIADFDFSAINELLEAGIIQVRNCAGNAYELVETEREKVLCNNNLTAKTIDEVLANAKQTAALTDTGTNLAVSMEKELD